jgi:hypothetical protein
MSTASRKSRAPIDGRKIMIRSLIALATALTFVLVLPTLAAAAAHTSGMITSWDEAMKQGTVRNSAGKETSFGWNETTKLTGTPNVGEHATVSYTTDTYGKRWATRINVAPSKAVQQKPPASTLPPTK